MSNPVHHDQDPWIRTESNIVRIRDLIKDVPRPHGHEALEQLGDILAALLALYERQIAYETLLADLNREIDYIRSLHEEQKVYIECVQQSMLSLQERLEKRDELIADLMALQLEQKA